MPLQCRSQPLQGWVTPNWAVDLTVKDANSCRCSDPSQALPSDTFSPELGRVRIQSYPLVFLSICPCSAGVGLEFFFWGSCFSSCRVQVPDDGLGFHPKDQAMIQHLTWEHPGLVLSLILPASVLKHRILIILGLHLSTLLQKGHRKQAFDTMFCGISNFILCQVKRGPG